MAEVDRETLVEAAASEMPTYTGPGGALDWEKGEWAAAALDAVLPLIAQELARRAERCQAECRDTPPCKLAIGYEFSADLVRSLGGNDRSSSE